MKTLDLSKETCSLIEVLEIAKSDAVLIRSASGEDFLLEPADEFDREVAALGNSASFASFLEKRSLETGAVPLAEARRKRGI
jgi:hypothetical protein